MAHPVFLCRQTWQPELPSTQKDKFMPETPFTPLQPGAPLTTPDLLGTARATQSLAAFILSRYSWFIAFIVVDILVIYAIATSDILQEAWDFIIPGIGVTIQVTLVAFVIAMIIGLITAFGRISKNPIIYNLSTFYIELFRGLPLLVIILIFAFVITPAFVTLVSGGDEDNAGSTTVIQQPRIPFADDLIQRLVGIPEERIATSVLRTRDIDPIWRIMFAFALTYGAFMSEVFRAGIESIGTGQMEAARSLGMNYFQGMRHIILPQAIRNILPALVNNFVFLLKDTSLASVVAVPEISHLTRQYSSNRFRYPEGLLVLSFIYANLTIFLSMGAIYLEAKLHKGRDR
jgi:polar amino acid transport system permease protein